MSARDIIHDETKNALIKDGWKITHDPLTIWFDDVDMYVDLGAEKVFAAEKEGEKIAVEVKSFLGGSLVSEFHKAIGQFLDYRVMLNESDPQRRLYLAIPLTAYHAFFTKRFAQAVIKQYDLKLIILDVERGEIVSWKN